MNIKRHGIILNTENFRDCVAFYRDAVGLRVAEEINPADDEITVFDLDGAYLVVETGGNAANGVKDVESNPTKFRFNVEDVEASATTLRSRAIAVEVFEYDWGTTAEFFGPDGNRCALRSQRGFGIQAQDSLKHL
ncbi:MAG: glyoxalase [Alphaproteobacteria bacterium]|nr:glyoxalase [Alphaproteobacteria bacterium]